MKFKVTIGVAILGLFIVGMAVKQVAEKKIVSIGNEQALIRTRPCWYPEHNLQPGERKSGVGG